MSAARVLTVFLLLSTAACERAGESSDSATDTPPAVLPGDPVRAIATDRTTTRTPREAAAAMPGSSDSSAQPAHAGAQAPVTDSPATEPDPATRTEPPAAAVEPAEPPQEDVAKLLRRTASIYSAMQSLRAGFTMHTRNPLLRTQVTSHGTLFQRRPDRILLRFTDPAGDLIVGDGRYFWIYYPSVDAKQVIRTPAAGTAGVVDLQAQFVGDPLVRFDHTAEGREPVGDRDAAVITLVPREDLGYQKLKVWIDVQDGLVRRFEITDPNGVSRRLDLSDLVVNPALGDELFTFTPPEGVRIVDRG